MANDWQEDELLLTLHLYCRTPFGKLHKTNPDIIQLANIIGRSPSAVALKAVNFASLDPSIHQKGMSNTSKADRAMWNAFMQNSTDIAEQAEALYESRITNPEPDTPVSAYEIKEPKFPTGETETIREIKARRVQNFFRRTVLQSYNNRCAISGLAIPQLLVASHIIPWSEDVSRRADPTNGIALNGLYDKAFDRHLISFDEDFSLIVSRKIKQQSENKTILNCFLNYEGKALTLPLRFYPDVDALKMHRDTMMND
jgi:predicted restriction endonuclease